MRQEMNRAGRDLNTFGRNANRALNGSGRNSVSRSGEAVSASMRNLQRGSGLARTAVAGLGAEMAGLSEAALAVGATLGPVGLGIGLVTVAAIAASAGIGMAAQTAVKFETDLKRLNMALGESTTKFMTWSRTQGLSRSTAAEMGATYGMLLSSFVKGNAQLEKSTEDLVTTTRVVASATGKSIEETTERLRSGLLGNTESIEDLGIFVNVAMIESTNAFKKFANGKHWDQIDFRVQQQIRLQAILEQAQARYGSTLQNSVMTKQQALSEQLKDIKLNLSQAFLPIWEKILPALSKLAEGIVFVTDKLARFSYWLTGKNYEEATKGTDTQTKATEELGDAYKEAGDKAKGALASFDEINQVGDFDGGPGTGAGGKPPSGGSDGSHGNDNEFNLPKLPKLGLVFEPPSPPDAGAGAVATAVVSTVNNMVAQTNAATQGMWNPALASMAGLNAQTVVTDTAWRTMLNNMQVNTNAYQPYISYGVFKMNSSLNDLTPVMTQTHTSWTTMLDTMQKKINAYQPYISYGLDLVGASAGDLQTSQAELETSWATSWQNMYVNQVTQSNKMLDSFETVKSAYVAMRQTMGETVSVVDPQMHPSGKQSLVMDDLMGSAPSATGATATSGIGNLLSTFDWGAFFKDKVSDLGEAGLDMLLSLGGMKGVQALGKLSPALKGILEGMFKGGGGAIPQLANGGITNGPTMAMIGDNVGGQEVVSPLDGLLDMIQSAVSTAVLTASQLSSGSGGGSQRDIVINIDGTTMARVSAPYYDKESNRVGGSMISIG